MRVLAHAPGHPGHGVVRHARAIAVLTGTGAGAGAPDLVHAHFTDALYGPDVAAAAEAFVRWADGLDRPLVVTLHDVPGGDPDAGRDARRAAGYRRVVGSAGAVIVSSRHEADRVLRVAGVRARVIPLPLPAVGRSARPPAWAVRPSLVVLGFVYPGKGHALAIEIASRHPARPQVVAAGAVSPGHGALRAELGERARGRVGLVVTGSLSAPELTAAALAATVPFAANPGVSASGSLLAWLAHRRRPVVEAGPYADELAKDTAALTPTLDPEAAVDHALRTPADTWLPRRPPWPDVGAAHRALYREVLAEC